MIFPSGDGPVGVAARAIASPYPPDPLALLLAAALASLAFALLFRSLVPSPSPPRGARKLRPDSDDSDSDSDPSPPPPFVPHLIPYFGSAFALRRDGVRFIERWSEALGNPGVFGALVAGRTVYFVTDPLASRHVISGRVPRLTWRRAKFMMTRNASGMFDDGAAGVVSGCSAGHGVVEGHLMRSDKLGGIMGRYQMCLRREWAAALPARASPPPPGGPSGAGWSRVGGVLDFFGTAIWTATCRSVYGYPSLSDPESFRLALKFDARFGALVQTSSRSLQHWRHGEAYGAREELVGRMGAILREGRSDRSEFVRDLDEVYRGKLGEEGLARYHFLMLMASVFNTVPTTFWVVYHLLADPSAYEAVEREVLAVCEERGQSNKGGEGTAAGDHHLFSLSDLEGMTGLDSVITETMRLYSTHSVIRGRLVESDFELSLPLGGGTRRFPVKGGNLIFTCPTLEHLDPEVFEDPKAFRWDRFLPDGGVGGGGEPPAFSKGGRRLLRPVNAWGGGPTMCPGRKLAVAEIKVLVATVLAGYDVRFAGWTVPDPPEMLDTGSFISLGMPAGDVAFEVRPRC